MSLLNQQIQMNSKQTKVTKRNSCFTSVFGHKVPHVSLSCQVAQYPSHLQQSVYVVGCY